MDAATTTTPAAVVPSRITETFARIASEGRIALMPYATAGYPTMELSEEIMVSLVEGGADLIEIGVPFSDPLADGPSVQHTSQVSLNNGTRVQDCIALVQRLRARGITVPLLLMGYFNPILKYGIDRYVADCAAAGVDGFIVPDLPAEESGPLRDACRAHQRDLIFMVAPTSTDERLELAATKGSGFIYCVSVKGVTGARDKMSDTLGEYLERIRSHTDLPLAVGFGISRPDHVRQVAEHAQGAIVGAALINYLDAQADSAKPAAAARFVQFLKGEGEL
jgi:tryptophan synthase alpha chain